MTSKVKPGTFFGRPPSQQSGTILSERIVIKNRADHYVDQQVEIVRDAQRDLERALIDCEHAQCGEEVDFCHKLANNRKKQYDRAIVRLAVVQKLATELSFTCQQLRGIRCLSERSLVQKRIGWLEERIKAVVLDGELDVIDTCTTPSVESMDFTREATHSRNFEQGLESGFMESSMPCVQNNEVGGKSEKEPQKMLRDEFSEQGTGREEETRLEVEAKIDDWETDPGGLGVNEAVAGGKSTGRGTESGSERKSVPGNGEELDLEEAEDTALDGDAGWMQRLSGKETDRCRSRAAEVNNSDSRSRQKPIFVTETLAAVAAVAESTSVTSVAADAPSKTVSPSHTDDLPSDACDHYWKSQHHRFAYSSLQHVDSLFYHKMALSVQGTYVNDVLPMARLPWRRRRSSSNISDGQTKGLNDLSTKVGRFCGTVREASKISIVVDGSTDVKNHISGNSATVNSSTTLIRQSTDASSRVNSRLLPPVVSGQRPKPVAMRTQILPLAPTVRSLEFPESSVNFSASIPGHDRPAGRIADQRHLLEETQRMTSLFKSKRMAQVKPASVESRLRQMLHNDAECTAEIQLAAEDITLQEKEIERLKNDPLKWERIQDLVNRCRASPRPDERNDCVKQLGALRCALDDVIGALHDVIAQDVDDRVVFEATKSLVRLGCYSDDVQQQLVHYLLDGNRLVKLDVIKTLIDGRRVPECDKETKCFPDLCRILSLLCHNADVTDDLSFHAAVCLHCIGVVDDTRAATKLLLVLNSSTNVHHRAKALFVLVHQVTSATAAATATVTDVVKGCLLEQLQHSVVWSYRRDAASHLIHLSSVGWQPSMDLTNVIYAALMKSLCSDVNSEVRLEAAKALTACGLIGRACVDVDRMLLNESSDKVRADAVIAVGTMGMKAERIVKVLIDMADLDVSHRVRRLVIRTFGQLNVRDDRILCLLETKANGRDEQLASEARKSLKALHQASGIAA